MENTKIATARIKIHAPRSKVWNALVDPEVIKKYMFDTNVVSDWQEGSPILWKGEWQGKKYEDKGIILRIAREKLIRYTHFSPMTGQPDIPENYHTVTIELMDDHDDVTVNLSQDNNQTEEEKQHSEKNWGMMLSAMKKLLES